MHWVSADDTAPVAQEQEFALEKEDKWKGFDRKVIRHTSGGYQAFVVEPMGENVDSARRWIWRARFFGHQPQLDIALLERGYHLVYCDVGGLFGSPEAVARWDSFYHWVRQEYQLAPKVILEGMSRGGLIIYNWGIANPDKVSMIYADAPVIDIRSWPGGKGSGKGSPNDWKKCLTAYGIADDARGNAEIESKIWIINQLTPLTENRVPLLHVVGEDDVVVPVSENTNPLVTRYRDLGGEIAVIRKQGNGHHPHALRNPSLILAFIDRFALE